MTLIDALQPAFYSGLLGLGAAVLIDWQAFKAFKSFNDLLKYDWGLATFRAFQGFIVGFLPSAVVVLKTFLQGG